MRGFTDYYSILGIKPENNQEEIKGAYRSLAKKFHPDLHPNNTDATIQMQLINEAYLILSDIEARKLYDAEYQRYFCSKHRDTQAQHTQQGTENFQYQSDLLKDWISKARQQAKDISA